MATSLTRELIGREQVCGGDSSTPHLGLENFNQSFDGLLSLAAGRCEPGRLSISNKPKKPAVRKRAFDRVVNHIMRDNALLRTT